MAKKLTVANAPWPLLWAANLFGAVAALGWLTLAFFLRLLLRIEWLPTTPPTGAAIYVFWHQWLPVWFVINPALNTPQVWMQHPVLGMRPIHFTLLMMGVKKLIYGSSGHGGRAALDQLARWVAQGHSTVLTPDGPAGPPKKAKSGAVELAAQTQVPLVPVRFEVSRKWLMPTWDRKVFPLPLAKVSVVFGQPIWVAQGSENEALSQLETALGR